VPRGCSGPACRGSRRSEPQSSESPAHPSQETEILKREMNKNERKMKEKWNRMKPNNRKIKPSETKW
jgi:hypothetical protein